MGTYHRDITGKRFGRLVVTRRDGVNRHGDARWLCVCDCGAEHSAMRRGARSTLHAAGDVYVYRMIDRREIIYVALNRGDAERSADGLPTGSYRDLRTGETLSGPVSLAPRGYRILARE